MKCDRCGSAMIQEMFYGPQEHFLGWKCIYCGEIIDYLESVYKLEGYVLQ